MCWGGGVLLHSSIQGSFTTTSRDYCKFPDNTVEDISCRKERQEERREENRELYRLVLMREHSSFFGET